MGIKFEMVLSMYLSGDKLGGGSIDRREVLHDDHPNRSPLVSISLGHPNARPKKGQWVGFWASETPFQREYFENGKSHVNEK